MISSIRHGIAALTSPNAVIAASTSEWEAIVASLRERGAGIRESGCFLLGSTLGHLRYVQDVVYFDDLDPSCMRGGAIELRNSDFSRVWKICEAKRMSVIADVHTHPGRAIQSRIDERNPGISTLGHIAMIIPDFARKTRRLEGVGLFIYRGAYRWDDVAPAKISCAFILRSWL